MEPLKIIDADIRDPGDPNFLYIGKRIVIRTGSRKSDYHWAMLYSPTPSCLAWDAPPHGVNVAIGGRYGFTYARVGLTDQVCLIPDGDIFVGRKGSVILYSHNFNRGYEPEHWKRCWIVSPVDRWSDYQSVGSC